MQLKLKFAMQKLQMVKNLLCASLCVCVCGWVCLCVDVLSACFNLTYWSKLNKNSQLIFSLSLSLSLSHTNSLCSLVSVSVAAAAEYHVAVAILFTLTYANILAGAGAPALNWNGAAFGVDCKRYIFRFLYFYLFLLC